MNQTETSHKQIESGFRKLLGRAPSQAEILDLTHIKDALSLRGDDPLWMILYALQYYKAAYKQIPGEINAALARTEAVLAQFDGEKIAEGHFFRMLGRWGQAKIIGGFLMVVVVAVGVGVFIGRVSVDEPARRLANLNGGAQTLISCFNGAGQLEQRSDGHVYCFPASSDGKVMGFAIK